MKINSNDWWEEYFQKNTWKENHGNEQSEFFINILLNNLSFEIKKEILDNNYTICDIGCAEGDGTNILNQNFPNNNIFGIDVSSTAIKEANNNYHNITFISEDINMCNSYWDVLICSNVLEHFENPKNILDKLLKLSKKYLIIMVPFEEEQLEPSHFYRFTKEYFNELPEEYKIVETNIIDTRNIQPTYWNGKQLLVVIKKDNNVIIQSNIGIFPDKYVWDQISQSYDIEISDTERDLSIELLEIISSLGLKKGDKIIELGCGSGHLSACLAQFGYDVTLLDFSKEALKKAKKTFEKYDLKGNFIEADIFDLHSISEHYDLVWNSGVMEHFDDDNLRKVFLSIKELLLLNKCKFLFLVPNPESISYLLMRYNLYSQEKWEYGYEYLRKNYLEIAKLVGLDGRVIGYASGSISKWHFESTFINDFNRKIYSSMMDNSLLPDNEKYLIAYSISIDEGNNHEIVNEKLLTQQHSIELEKYFQINAELFGKERNNILLKNELEIKENEINKLNGTINILIEKINQKNSLLEDKEKKLKENIIDIEKKEKIINKNIDEIKRKEKIITDLEAQFNDLSGSNIELNNKILQNKNTLLLIKNKCIIMGNSRLFKLIHFLFRTRYQGFNHNKTERKRYRHWLSSKLISKIGDNDRRYNPIYQILSIIDNNISINDVNFQVATIEKNTENQTKREILISLKKNILGKQVIIFPYTIDYNMPLFQRPQQLVKSYSKRDNIVAIYLTINAQYDDVKYAKKIQNNLWLVEKTFFEKHLDILENATQKILSISLTTNKHYINLVKPDKLIYEYIDELEIFYGYGPEMERDHEKLIQQADVTVCTATKLYKQVLGKAKNPIISTNAGDYEFFKTTNQYDINALIKEKIKGYDCILGYYGSLAEWVDYKIINEVALENKNWLWLLVGIDYDGSLEKSGILNLKNVLYIPPQPYEILPTFLKAFTVATIPFRINEITLSTSPVKLFEYMAAGKPILASKLPECLKYKSVITYANSNDFIEKVDNILSLSSNDIYWEELKNDASNNTWDAKVDEILSAINE